MYHSLIFDDGVTSINTWDDWHLVPSSRPVFNPPEPKTVYHDLDGADWHLDLTESITGEIVFNGRVGSIEFIVDNGHEEWYVIYSKIMDYLHGKSLLAILEDDPGYIYTGRFSVNQWKSEPHNSKIVIDYNVHPYKFERFSSLEDWEWDPFNFEDGIVREYNDLRVDTTLDLNVVGRRKSVTPSFFVQSDDGSGLEVTFDGITYSLYDGLQSVPYIILTEGENILTFSGNGYVSVDYRGGRL